MSSNGLVIEAENMVKRFGRFIANDNLTFSVSKGEIFGFLGANGAGKTTAIRILCGLSRPTSGKSGWRDMMCIPKPRRSSGASAT